jgi:large-conductance mechanosensitive channel
MNNNSMYLLNELKYFVLISAFINFTLLSTLLALLIFLLAMLEEKKKEKRKVYLMKCSMYNRKLQKGVL